MSDIAIQVDALGKRYRLGDNLKYRTLRDSWNSLFVRRKGRMEQDSIWALKDVSCDVKRGEVVGIIGRNGAGKSTLLKILSRITRPTVGTVDIYGRVGSLLEVGTGFHPELTGRENIFLNGAILGMTRREVHAKFDEIVAFAEIEQFIDTPVKRYSSGMYVRLAFAVAAHLEPEILLVDEVLAVGDVSFQKRCLGKMGELTGEGRTVLFVSHQMAAVQALCKTAMWIDHGTIRESGEALSIIDKYFADSSDMRDIDLQSRKDRKGSGRVTFRQVEYESENGQECKSLVTGRDGRIVLRIENNSSVKIGNLRIGVGIDTNLGQRVTTLSSDMSNGELGEIAPGVARVSISLNKLALTPGEYMLTLFCSVGNEVSDWVQQAVNMRVESGDFFGTGRVLEPGMGVMYLPHSMKIGERDE
ncbi:MAG: ABC transporter ATP-binding protein [Gammaproteobacteria bacterium]|nr:ABC transporter ATP-binding protein [Gammaproteobacteria bacterium]